RYRYPVGDSGLIGSKRIINVPWMLALVTEGAHRNVGYETWCEVCSTFCPAPPVDVRAKREKMLVLFLAGVAALHGEDQ
ncbi:unnamed protein product, partial [marine sediment metagenome]